jgi:hypothetical protein
VTRKRRTDAQHLGDALEHLRVLRAHLTRGSLDDALIRDAVCHRLELAIDAVAKVNRDRTIGRIAFVRQFGMAP